MCADIVNHEDEVISVGQLNQQAKQLLESQFRGISVLGEISNLARPSSGHIYFTLKEEAKSSNKDYGTEVDKVIVSYLH